VNELVDSPLGRNVAYASRYDAGLLFAIARAPDRAALGIHEPLPFHGVDIWNAYELAWLDARGKPEVALAEFRVPATSPAIIESKSLKLYLNSFSAERVGDGAALRAVLVHDLSLAAGAAVEVLLTEAAAFPQARVEELDGISIDHQAIAIDLYGPPDAALLQIDRLRQVEDETLVSHLLKSNCPVTGQPDWASLQIRYGGPRIERAGLLRYIVSYREHAGFHEQCVERIYTDLVARCAPARLQVYARYTRRGGLDINPFRSSSPLPAPNPRGARQ
jgi:7-cyano-7-deazaguanine reductase